MGRFRIGLYSVVTDDFLGGRQGSTVLHCDPGQTGTSSLGVLASHHVATSDDFV